MYLPPDTAVPGIQEVYIPDTEVQAPALPPAAVSVVPSGLIRYRVEYGLAPVKEFLIVITTGCVVDPVNVYLSLYDPAFRTEAQDVVERVPDNGVSERAIGVDAQTVFGVMALDAVDVTDEPMEFLALTVNVYEVPLVNPATVAEVPVVVTEIFPGFDVTV